MRIGSTVEITNEGSTFYGRIGVITEKEAYSKRDIWYRVFFEDFRSENPKGVAFTNTEMRAVRKTKAMKDAEAINKIVEVLVQEWSGDFVAGEALNKIDAIVRTVRDVGAHVQASKV